MQGWKRERERGGGEGVFGKRVVGGAEVDGRGW